MRSALLGLLLLFSCIASASAASTVRLPPGLCSGSDVIFASGFENAPAIPHDPSNGSGGAFPGNVTRTVAVSGFGNRNYYLHLPPNYTPAQSWPLLLVLRGSTAPASMATAAQQVRSD